MPPPSLSSSLTIRDDGVATSNSSAEGVVCYIGKGTDGDTDTLYSFAGSDTGSVVDELGKGAVVDQTIEHLIRSGGKTTKVFNGTASTAGSSSAVTKTGSGPTVSLTGTPNDNYEYIIEIVDGGAVATATFIYSEDGGDTWSDEIVTASTYLLPSGVTANFAAGTYVADTTYDWVDTGPGMTTTNVGNHFDSIRVSGVQVEGIHLCGQGADSSAAVTMATLIGTKVDAFHAAHKYIWASMEAPAVDQALLIAAFSSFTYRWLMVWGGFMELIQQRNGQIQKRNSARVGVPRVVRNPLSVQPVRDAADSSIDPVSGIATLVPSGAVAADGYHDENATPGFDAARIASLRKFDSPDTPGVYISHAPMMSLSSSPMQTIAHVRVILRAAQAYYGWSLTQLGKRLRRDGTTGFILPNVADALETDATRVLKAAVGEHCDGISVLVNRTDDLSSDPTLRAQIRIVVAGYIFVVESEIGFVSALPVAA